MLLVKNLCVFKRVKNATITIVDNLNFSLVKGESLAIMGKSGSGKTMSALALFKLLPKNCFANGQIFLNDTNLFELNENKIKKLRGVKMLYIPQNGIENFNPSFTLKYQIFQIAKKAGLNKNEAEITIKNLLNEINLNYDILKKYPFQISGGEAQRLIVLSALILKPEFVIFDEPTKGLDEKNNIFLLLSKLLLSFASVINITHDISVSQFCDKILVIDKGKTVEYGNAKQIINFPKSLEMKNIISTMPVNW